MKTVVCPYCDARLDAAEASEGWCESCGKHLPEGFIGGAHRLARQDRLEERQKRQAEAATPGWRRAAHDLFARLAGLFAARR
jgi:hypothetical protein